MLELISSMKKLPFGAVIDIYSEYQGISIGMRKVQDFYTYLKEDFFPNNGVYALWEDDGEYKAAVRLVPWNDGILLTGLETKIGERRRGYAKALLLNVAELLKGRKCSVVYSHIHKKNTASIAAHRACGFTILAEKAGLLDGSVLSDHYTLISHL